MSKKKQESQTQTEPPEQGGEPRPIYDFAHGKRCPACRGTDTQAKSTQGNVQYRQCRRVGCANYRKNYTVVGKQV